MPRGAASSSTSVEAPETSLLLETLEDLSCRFILNLPESELASIPRIYFQLEACWWFYEDFCRETNPSLPSYTLKRFAEILFKVCPTLNEWTDEAERMFLEFMRYKSRVPVCGAIMINETWDKCVLVKGWKGNSWSFPKGKINQDEPKHICAIREVLEETGFDLASLLNPADYLEVTIQDQRITLYIVPGVPEAFPFQTQTRKEISAIQWFKLRDLPLWSKKKGEKAGGGRFYMLAPFIQNLRKFVKQRQASDSSALPAHVTEEEPTSTSAQDTLPSSPIIEPLSVQETEREPQAPASELDALFASFLAQARRPPSPPPPPPPTPPPSTSILDDLFLASARQPQPQPQPSAPSPVPSAPPLARPPAIHNSSLLSLLNPNSPSPVLSPSYPHPRFPSAPPPWAPGPPPPPHDVPSQQEGRQQALLRSLFTAAPPGPSFPPPSPSAFLPSRNGQHPQHPLGFQSPPFHQVPGSPNYFLPPGQRRRPPDAASPNLLNILNGRGPPQA